MIEFSHLLNNNHQRAPLKKQKKKAHSLLNSLVREQVYCTSEATETYTKEKDLELAEERSDKSLEGIKEYFMGTWWNVS